MSSTTPDLRNHDPRILREHGLDIAYLPRWLDLRTAARIFSSLRETISWRQERIRIFGREVPIPRLQAWHGDPGAVYTYSGLRMRPAPWSPELLELREKLAELRPDAWFDSVLLNLYRHGRDSMGWHSDDEPELGPDPIIASVSLGANRRFQLRHRTRKDLPRIDLDLEPGSVLVMQGSTRMYWQHALPKRTGRNDPGPRINLTFRRIVAPNP